MYAGDTGRAVFYQSGNLLKLKDEEIEREVREDD